jgi:hypothetical protein
MRSPSELASNVRASLQAALEVVRQHAAAARRRLSAAVATGRARAEALIGEKIRRRVQPPIVAALATSAAALVIAVAAFFR